MSPNLRQLSFLRSLPWFLALGMTALPFACSIDERVVEVNRLRPDAASESSPHASTGDAGSSTPNDREPGTLGARCTSNAECDSTFCVDGVCCASSCDQVCSACDTAGNEGSCTVVGQDAECGGRCPFSTECLSYGSGSAAANCVGLGECRLLNERDCALAFSSAGTPCAETGACNGEGACAVEGKKLLGEACDADDECAEGYCVTTAEGAAICCTAACDGPCQACNPAGRCEEVPQQDVRCGAVDCPPDNLCRNYSDDLPVSACRGFGECLNVRDCSFEEVRPAAECACDEGGSCALVVGASCQASAECRSSACQPDVSGNALCCALDCAALGLRCSADGARCVECEGALSECVDADNVRRCAEERYVGEGCGNGCDVGSGACNPLRELGAACSGTAQCASGLCAPDISGTSRCCDAGCVTSGRVCGTAGTCVCPAGAVEVEGECRGVPGTSCTAGGDCASGFCVDTAGGGSVCCDAACAGDFCATEGTSCVECEGSGAACAGNVSQQCVDGALIPNNCGNGCDPTTGFCEGLLAQGATCTAGAQCGSGNCDVDIEGDSRCCPTNCATTGRVCGANGACVCSGDRDFVNGACRARVGVTCTADGDCGSGACESTQFNGNVCCSTACPGLQCRGSGQGCVECEGAGTSCQGNTLARCQNNFLQLTSCGNGCSVQGGQAACNPLLGRGSPCTQDAQCDPRLECVAAAGGDRRCCDPGCTSTGRTCDAAGLCQCPPGQVFGGNRCGLNEGGVCQQTSDCLGNLPCTPFFIDLDFDGFGSEEVRVCGTEAPPPVTMQGSRGPVEVSYVPAGGDCCDLFGEFRGTTLSSAPFEVNPGVTTPSSRGASACPVEFDFNCDGVVTPPNFTIVPNTCGPNCTGGGVVSVSSPTCPGTFSTLGCGVTSQGGCVAVGNGGPMACL